MRPFILMSLSECGQNDIIIYLLHALTVNAYRIHISDFIRWCSVLQNAPNNDKCKHNNRPIQFVVMKLTSDNSRFNAVVASIESKVSCQVSDAVLRPPDTGKYTNLTANHNLLLLLGAVQNSEATVRNVAGRSEVVATASREEAHRWEHGV